MENIIQNYMVYAHSGYKFAIRKCLLTHIISKKTQKIDLDYVFII